MTHDEKHEKHGHAGHEEHGHHPGHDEHKDVFIHIDHKKYDVDEHVLTGAMIHQLARPPIGQEYDLFLETRGPGDDRKIGDEEKVHIRECESFYSVLRQINPGANREAA